MKVDLGSVVLAALLSATLAAAAQPYLGKVFLGIQGDTIALPDDAPATASTHGIQLTLVAAGSAAQQAGLRIGDIVVSLDGKSWTDEEIRLSRSFDRDDEPAQPGQAVEMTILRLGQHGYQTLTFNFELTRYPRTAAEAQHPTNAELRPDLVTAVPDYEPLCQRLIEHFQWAAPCTDLLARLDNSQRFPDPERLALQRFVQRDPFRIETVARDIVSRIDPAAACASALALGRFCLLDFARSSTATGVSEDSLPTFAGRDLAGHLEYISEVLRLAAAHHQRAFARLTPAEADFLRRHRDELSDAFLEYKMLSYDEDSDRQQRALELLDLGGRVDVGALIDQATTASLLLAPAFLRSLQQAVAASGKSLDGGVVVQQQTEFGIIRIAGTGRSRYQGEVFAALFELGGDDVYANHQGASVWGEVPTAVVVDLAGDDAYETYDYYTQACGDMGVGMIADLAGSDSYIGSRFTQGAAFLGVGMLIDEAGDDTYRGMALDQGVALWGIGGLIDLAGNDRYDAHVASQGVGLPGGLGLLFDAGGDDHYYCKGSQASGYGTRGVFEGWGQGLGIGFRPYASGGVGVLDDRGGTDRMEAGNFSQGGGYFYGFGLLHAGGAGDDVYIGSRWAQGFGCHQAAGAMIEAGGNDRYTTRYAVAQGIAWDESTVFFTDESGDDLYEGGGFSQGAAAMNGWSVFIERRGNDTYRFTDQARAGGNDYHGGKSLAFFVDAAGDDSYPKFANDSIRGGGENGIFVDLPDGNLAPGDDVLQSSLAAETKSP